MRQTFPALYHTSSYPGRQLLQWWRLCQTTASYCTYLSFLSFSIPAQRILILAIPHSCAKLCTCLVQSTTPPNRGFHSPPHPPRTMTPNAKHFPLTYRRVIPAALPKRRTEQSLFMLSLVPHTLVGNEPLSLRGLGTLPATCAPSLELAISYRPVTTAYSSESLTSSHP